ncbi:septation protein IspZ [Ponticaulis sp.]|uniref:inner membrane-spanning protein YciB n=1 Tax=Ponticaulis sp. TaxID=2020902 RepID=UPI000C4A38CA|nr:septation protein IspZ [Ponticaulis sp.]MBN05114.1 intracellular septation protein A [Ponticaulis sp.]
MTDAQDPAEKQQSKSPTSLWAELGPTIAFILTYTLMGRVPDQEGMFSGDKAIFWATGALMLSTAIVIGLKLSRKEKVPPMLILSGSVVGFFGVLTIALQQEAFAYIKPTIINLLFAAVILGGLAAGKNLWKLMLEHAFELPDNAWNTLAFRWGLFFIFLAVLNECIWRYFCPAPETPLTFLGLTLVPSEPYTLFGIELGSRDQEGVWAWMKLVNFPIVIGFMLLNLPYVMKYWSPDKKDEAES